MAFTVTPALLVPPVQVPAVAGALLAPSGPAGAGAVCGRATVTNVASIAVSLTLYIVPAGGTPTTANTVIQNLLIAPNVQLVLNELAGVVIPNGSSIWGVASASGSLNFTLSGFSYVSA